jgi:ABC-type transporter lipoprotein component MlaA
VLVIVVGAGCAQPVMRHDWSAYDGPGAAAFHREKLPTPNFPDPLEPINRGVYAINHAFIAVIADPIGQVYRRVTPRFLRDRVRDFTDNLIFPRNLIANLFQGKWSGAGNETARFALNTTVGVAGLWDPATQWWGVPAAPEDFGHVFARWGWQSSTFVFLPIVGPSSARDGLGLIPDMVLDPATYFFPAGPLFLFNEHVEAFPEYRRFVASSFDPYDDMRLLWSFEREARIDPPVIGTAGADTGAVQTLRAAFLVPRDPDFAASLRTVGVVMPTTGQVLPVSHRMQPGRAPLVFVVPGLGAHRLSGACLALAELVWERGFSVAIVSSTMNAEFIARGGSVPVPGHAPVDAHDVHIALDAVAHELQARYPERIAARVYLGYSLGAFHGFFIAAEEQDPANRLIKFDRYLLLDPPVRLIDGMERIDAFHDVPLALPPPEREPEARRILVKAAWAGRKVLAEQTGIDVYSQLGVHDLEGAVTTADAPLPFTNEEAEYLIGAAFRRSLKAVLWASQEREDLGILRTERQALRRHPPYEEIADYSFTTYFYGFVFPYYRDRKGMIGSAGEVVAANDLHAIAGALRGNPKLRVFANQNDFLNSEDDVRWLTALIGPERAHFFPSGGHLGNLHRPDVQADVMSSVADLAGTHAAP